jgi:hypothetical protein
MHPRVPVCAAIASLCLSACQSPSASLPRDALRQPAPAPAMAAPGLAMSAPPAAPFADVSDGVARRVAILPEG